jgi:sigma-B regulation protein RsbU (phosphoserine phosphatase)
MGLRAKFGVWTGVFTIALMVGVGFYFTAHERAALRREMELRGVAIAQNVAANAEDPLSIGDDLLLAKIVVDTKRDNEGVLYCFITDAKSRIVAHDDIYQIGTIYESQSPLEPLGQAAYRAQLYPTAQGDVYNIVAPIEIRGQRIGSVHLGIAARSIQEAIASAQRGTILFTVVAIFIGILISIGFVTYTTRHIGRITDDIMAIGEGDLDRPIEVKGRDEIARIGYEVKAMAQKLKRSQTELVDRERMKRELEIAREIQATLLPGSLPQPPGYELIALYRPSRELSGDYYDVIEMPGQRVGLVMADVAGKGVGGSLISMMLRSVMKIESQAILDARDTVIRTHSLLKPDMPEGGFITLYYGILDIKSGELNYVSAGHNPAIFYRAQSRELLQLKPPGLPLGMTAVDEATWASQLKSAQIEIQPGDLLVLYTDGITECRNPEGELFGMERFLKLIKEAEGLGGDELKESITRALADFLAGAPPQDDIALLVVKGLGSIKI